MTPPALIARLAAFGDLGTGELDLLMRMAGPTLQLKRRAVVRRQGDGEPAAFLLLSGWAASHMTLPGGARRMTQVYMTGDMLGTASLALTCAADTIAALTDCVVLRMPLGAFGELFEDSPRLAALLFLVALEERMLLADRLASMSASSVIERVAALVLHLHGRLVRLGADGAAAFHVPLTQRDLADLAGATPVHVNRVLRQLQDRGVIRWSEQVVTILDRPALQDLSNAPTRDFVHEPAWLPATRGAVPAA